MECDHNRHGAPACLCNDGYYENGCECEECRVACKTCHDSWNCDICSENREHSPECRCPSGTYDCGHAACCPCDDKCITCVDSADHCLTCYDIRTPAPICDCPLSWYEESNGECEACMEKCVSCHGHAGHCDECRGSRINPQIVTVLLDIIEVWILQLNVSLVLSSILNVINSLEFVLLTELNNLSVFVEMDFIPSTKFLNVNNVHINVKLVLPMIIVILVLKTELILQFVVVMLDTLIILVNLNVELVDILV